MIRSWGEKRSEPRLKNHVELVELLGIADVKKGTPASVPVNFSFKVDEVTIINL